MVDSLYSAITNVEQAQSQKEVTINEGFDRISAMMAATLIQSMTSGDFTPTSANPTPQWQANLRFELTGTPGVPRLMICPSGAAFCKLFIVQNDSDDQVTVQVGAGPAGTTVVILASEKALLYSDGTDILQEGGTGSDTFLGLTDVTPSTFVGDALKAVRVNAAETALEFGTVSGAGGTQQIAIRPAHQGAQLRLAVSVVVTTATLLDVPWDTAVYDTTFQPATGGAQRFWLDVDQTFVDANVNTGTDQVAITAHGFITGEGPLRLTSSGTLPAGLALATNYWLIRIDNDNLQFATDRANALAGTPVDITAAAGGGTHTLETAEKLVVPAGVTKVRLVGQVSWEDIGASNVGERFIDIDKNGTSFQGGGAVSYEALDNATADDKTRQVVTTGVIEVVEGDYFSLEVRHRQTVDLDVTSANATNFFIEVIETTEVQPLPVAFLAVQPAFEGALLKRSGTFATAGANEPLPFQTADYDTTFNPNDGGPVQRFWLDVNRTFVDGDVTVGTDVVGDTAHGFTTGEGPVRLISSGTLPAGLSLATDYWIIRVDDDNLAFATTRALALADTRVDITAAAGGGTHTIETENKLVIPAGVTRVRLKGGIDTGGASSAVSVSAYINKNGNGTMVFPGEGGGSDAVGSAATGSRLVIVGSAVLDVSEGDHFELGIFVDSVLDVDANGATFFSIEVVETSKDISFPGVTVERPFIGIAVQLDANLVDVNTVPGLEIPWESATFDTGYRGIAFAEFITNPERITIPAGITRVKVGASFFITDYTGDTVSCRLKLNGSVDFQGSCGQLVGRGGFSDSKTSFSSGILDVVEGDFFEVQMLGRTDTTASFDASRCNFWLEVVETEDAAQPPEQVEHFAVGIPTISITIFAKVAARRFSLFDNFLNSQAVAQTAPTGAAVDYDVHRNNVSIGTISFADGVPTATFTTAGSVQEDFEIGDVLEIITPSDLQTMADVAFNLWAFRS